MQRRPFIQTSLTIAMAGCFAVPALAQADFPQRAVTLVVPFAPGGSVDTVARMVAERWGKQLGQQVLVDNKAGAATIIAADQVRKAAPDGYTLLIGTSTTFVVNPIIYAKLPYDAVTSFDPVGVLGSSGLAVLVTAASKVKTLPELLADMRAHPGNYSYGSHGNGSTVHFAAEMLWSAAKLRDVVHVPYKGSSPAMNDLMGGQIPVAFDAIPAAAAAVKGGRVRALAVTSVKRSALLPEVPTVAESGFPGFKMTSWFGIVGPKGMPPAVKSRLEKTLSEVMSDPAVVGRLEAAGFDVKWSPSAEYASMIKSDTADLAPIAKAHKITAEN